MKTILVALFVVTMMATAALADGLAGPYQLFSGTLQIGGPGGPPTNHPVILMIDTQTGKVWEYLSGTGKDGKFRQF